VTGLDGGAEAGGIPGEDGVIAATGAGLAGGGGRA